MRRLNCPVQQYAWGKRGSDSKVARLKKKENTAFSVDEEQPYAELWMGTHPNGPSRVMPTEADLQNGQSDLGIFLIELLETFPHYLGELEEVGDLPFMFKILSIDKALSIQAHPDKKLAERLYATRPDLYKDDNHKPEMAVALSSFEGLCGFRAFDEIAWMLQHYPELSALAGPAATAAVINCQPEDLEAQQAALAELFRAYITAPTTSVATQLSNLLDRLGREASFTLGTRTNSDSGSTSGSGGPASPISAYAAPTPTSCHGNGHGGFSGSVTPSSVGSASSLQGGRWSVAAAMAAAAVGSSSGGGGGGGGGSVGASSAGGSTDDDPVTEAGTTDQEDLEDDETSSLSDLTLVTNHSPFSQKSAGSGARTTTNSPFAVGSSTGAAAAAAAAAVAGNGTGAAKQTAAVLRSSTVSPKRAAAAALQRRRLEERMRGEDFAVRRLMQRLAREYPNDIGIMMPLLLNYLRMEPGEAFFMAANEPHAYLRGDIMEVMARSDNVVRVALTQKHRDVPLLLEVLTYHMGPPPVVKPSRVDNRTVRYTPPIADFELEVTTLPEGEEMARAAMPVPQILLCLAGGGTVSDAEGTSHEVWPGCVIFVPADSPLTYVAAAPDAAAAAASAGDERVLRIVSSHTNRRFLSQRRSSV